jgi:hypothetical protein
MFLVDELKMCSSGECYITVAPNHTEDERQTSAWTRSALRAQLLVGDGK